MKKNTLIKRAVSTAAAVCLLVCSMTGSAFAGGYSGTDIHPLHAEAAYVQEAVYDGDECFAGYAERVLYGTPAPSLYGRSAGSRLSDTSKNLYDALKGKLQAIPDSTGSEASAYFQLPEQDLKAMGIVTEFTNEDLGLDSIYNKWGDIDQATVDAVFSRFLSANGLALVTDALMLDLPYDMFWYGHEVSYGANFGVLGESLFIKEFQIGFIAAENYRGSDEYAVDLKCMNTVRAAASNAQSIVSKYADSKDFEKLQAYCDEICALADYDFPAASSGSALADTDPWQLIHVFDGDPSTKVVCEGYSKAFQYLCDLSGFDEGNDVVCYTVSGYMGSETTQPGAHMWNIVRMEDGRNYLMDITNSDDSAIGAGGELFLAGAEGSVSEGYVFPIADTYAYYIYSPDQMSLWGTGEDSVLKLASSSYIPGIIPVPVLPGDTNGDGKISAADLTLLARHVAKISSISGSDALANADIDGDGKPDTDDVVRLARYLAKITKEL